MTAPAERAELFFDPGCPWTWRTASWLRTVAAARPLALRWRPLALSLLSPGPVPAAWQAQAEVSTQALRVIALLGDGHRDSDIEAFYLRLGTLLHAEGRPPGPGLVLTALAATGLDREPEVRAAVTDPALDRLVKAGTEEAAGLVGSGLGSPVLALTAADGQRRGLFGPVVTTTDVTASDSLRLWDAVVTLTQLEAFAEVKRARDLGPLDTRLQPHL